MWLVLCTKEHPYGGDPYFFHTIVGVFSSMEEANKSIAEFRAKNLPMDDNDIWIQEIEMNQPIHCFDEFA